MQKYPKLNVLAEILLGIFAFMVIAFIFWGRFYSGVTNESIHYSRTSMDDGWVRVYEDGTEEPVTMPSNIYCDSDEPIVLQRVLPDDIEDGFCLSTRAIHMDMSFYVDGEFRYERIQDQESIPYREAIVSKYMYCPVGADDRGKIVKVVASMYEPETYCFRNWYYGEKVAHTILYLRQSKVELGFGVAFGILGLVCIIVGISFRIATKGKLRLDFMGWALFSVAMWNMCQSDYRDFFFNNLKAISIIPVCALMMLSINVILFMNSIQRGRYEGIYLGYVFLSLGYMGFILILEILRISDFYKAIYSVFGIMFTMVIVCIITQVIDWKKGYLKEYRWVSLGFVFVTLFSAMQAASYTWNYGENSPVFLSLGFLLLVIVAYIQAVVNFMSANRDRQKAEIEAETKGKLMASLSHEIRTPINAVLGMNDMILRESGEEKIKGYAQDVDSAGKMLLSLINDILDISKMDSGRMTLVPAAYNTKDIIRDCHNLIEKRAADKGLLLIVDASPDIPRRLHGDDIRIKQIIINLLTNAVKYTEGGRVKFIIEGEETGINGYNLRVRVIDTGMGISKENQAKLFQEYTRVDEIRNKNVEGTGLGLTITAELVRMMKGTIEVDSTPGVGSEFIVNIPQTIVDKTPMGDGWESSYEDRTNRTATADKPLFKAPRAKVLVVDDMPLNLRVCEGLLKNTEVQIDTAVSGDECIFKAESYKYDLILLDQFMPGKTGAQTIRELEVSEQNLNKDTPIVILTANTMDEASELKEVEFAGFLTKPFNIQQIQALLLEHLPKDKIDEEQ